MLLLKFEEDWADEFDCIGFAFVKEEVWEYVKKEVEHCSFPMESYFGTNEAIIFESASHFINSFKVKEISELEMNMVKTILDIHGNEYGICPYYACESQASKDFYDNNEYPGIKT